MTRFLSALRDGVVLACGVALALLIAAKLDRTAETRLTGPFFVIDGDTLAKEGERLRLEGLDAPELDQTCDRPGGAWPCGRQARNSLARLVSATSTVCSGSRRDRYQRLLVRCRADRTDINAEQVLRGMAVAYGDYLTEERAARGEQAGLWAGRFDMPGQWRHMRGAMDDGEVPDFRTWLMGLIPTNLMPTNF